MPTLCCCNETSVVVRLSQVKPNFSRTPLFACLPQGSSLRARCNGVLACRLVLASQLGRMLQAEPIRKKGTFVVCRGCTSAPSHLGCVSKSLPKKRLNAALKLIYFFVFSVYTLRRCRYKTTLLLLASGSLAYISKKFEENDQSMRYSPTAFCQD